MTGQRRLATAGLVALAVLAGCTAHDTVPPAPTGAAPTTARPTGEPPAPVVRAAVDLSPALAGPAVVASAAATPDGGAVVVLRPADGDGPLAVATVDASGTLLRSVPAPELAQIFGAHLLPDGEVVVTGQFPPPDRDYGFVAVDPRSGATRTVVAARYERGTAFSFGRSTISADGSRLFLFVATAVDDRHLDLLVALDPGSGAFLGGRDLLAEVREVSSLPVETHSSGLLPRPDGGVTLTFDTWQDGGDSVPDTGVLTYDADLQPAARPTRVRLPGGAADGQAAAVAPDGTVHMVVQPTAGDLLVTVHGGVGVEVADLGGHADDDSLALDPTGEWAVLPAADGARAVDLRTGGVGRVAVGCPTAEPVQQVLPGAGPTRALLTGECLGAPRLWLLGG
jgi:hypothetical protein